MKLIFCFTHLFTILALAAPVRIENIDLFTGQLTKIDSGTKGTVVIFLSSRCPCSNSHNTEIKNLSNEYKEFSFVAVNANQDESMETSQTYFRRVNFEFPVLRDKGLRLANSLKALKTPHAFLLSPEGDILYQGGVTNSNNAGHADKNYLRDALASIRIGERVKVPEGRTLGCIISRGDKGDKHEW